MLPAVLFYVSLFVGLLVAPTLLILFVLWLFDRERPFWGRLRTFAAPIGQRLVKLPVVGYVRTRFPRTLLFLARRVDPKSPWGLPATLAFAFLVLGCWFLGDILRQIVGTNPLVTIDHRLHNSVPLFRSKPVTAFLLAVTELGGAPFLWPFGIGLALLAFAREKRRLAATFLLALVGFSLLSVLIKFAVGHPRPEDPLVLAHANSFPSGHTLGSAVVYGLLASVVMGSRLPRLARAVLATILILCIVAVGVSRVYLGVHWPSDVLGSLALALSCLACLLFFLRYPRPLSRLEALASHRYAHLAGTVGWLWIAVAVATAVLLFGRTKMRAVGPPPVARSVEIRDLLESLPPHVPGRSEDLVGREREPITLVLVGTRDELLDTFRRAGWTLADLPTPVRVVREALAAATRTTDPSAPVLPAYFADRPQTFAFEKPDSAAPGKGRRVTRVWQTAYCVAPDCQTLWVATTGADGGDDEDEDEKSPRREPRDDGARTAAELVAAGSRALGDTRIVDAPAKSPDAGKLASAVRRVALLAVLPRSESLESPAPAP